MEYPRRAELSHICGIDFTQTTVAPSAVVAVVGSPVGAGWLRKQVLFAHIRDGSYSRFASLPRTGQAR